MILRIEPGIIVVITAVATVAGGLRQRDRAPALSERKLIKQAGSDSVDSHPKAKPQQQRGLSLYTI
jgi:hypothetical protein